MGNAIATSVHLNDDGQTATVVFPFHTITFNTATGEALQTVQREAWNLSPDGSKKIERIEDPEFTYYWIVHDLNKGMAMRLYADKNIYDFLGFSPDGSKLTTIDRDPPGSVKFLSSVSVWDSNTGKRLYELKDSGTRPGFLRNPYAYSLRGAKSSPDGSMIVTPSQGKRVVLWDAATGNQLKILNAKETDWTGGYIEEAWFSPDSSEIVAVSNPDWTAMILDIRTGETKTILRGHTASIRSVSWSPDRSKILTASQDKRAILWDSRNGEMLREFAHETPLWSAAFNSDETKIITGGNYGSVSIWRIAASAQEMEEIKRKLFQKVSVANDSFQETAEKRFKLPWSQERNDR